jgi:hypothetical protein
MKIVETDNFGGDYPNEKFVNLPSMPKEQCKAVADIVNGYTGENSSRYWKVVEDDYKLQPGFEP